MANGAGVVSPEETKEQLAGARNRKAAQQRTQQLKSDISDAGMISNAPAERMQAGEGTQTYSDSRTGYVGHQAGQPASTVPSSLGTTSQSAPGAPSPQQQAGVGGGAKQQAEQLNGARQQARKAKGTADQQGEQEGGTSPASKKSPQQKQIDKEYPKPVPFTVWMILFAVALLCDLVTLILTLTGVGEILGWVIGCIPIAMYYPLYWLRFPKNPLLKRSLNIRSIMNYAIELVPYLGSVWIGNSLVVIYAYVMIKKYERGAFSGAGGQALSGALTSGAGAGTPQR